MNWQTDGSQAGVQNAVASASAGDTVLIPAGTFTWAGTLSINKGISLVGVGQNQTTIQNNNGVNRMIDASSGHGRRHVPPAKPRLLCRYSAARLGTVRLSTPFKTTSYSTWARPYD